MIRLFISVLFITSLSFSACSKTPDEPYYDRVQNASQKAQSQLQRD